MNLLNNIEQFAKEFQPIVIEIDLADVPFYKKIPKNFKPYKPKLLLNVMKRLKKSLKGTERVILIGKASSPWLTKAKPLVCIYIFYTYYHSICIKEIVW